MKNYMLLWVVSIFTFAIGFALRLECAAFGDGIIAAWAVGTTMAIVGAFGIMYLATDLYRFLKGEKA